MSYRWITLFFCLACAISAPALAEFELKVNKGLAAYLNKDYQAAVKLLEEALEENPNSAPANHILGLSLLRINKYKRSISYLEKAKELDPNLKGIDFDLGTAYFGLGNLKQAESEFREATHREPENGLAFYNLGYTQFKLGDYEEAILSLEKASELDSDLAPQSHFYAGVSRYRLYNYQSAKTDFLLVKKLAPRSALDTAAEEYLDVIAWLTKRYYGVVSSGFQYDSNVVLEPEQIEIISDKSAARAIFFLNFGYKPYLKPDASIGGDYTAYFSFNHGLEEFNVQSHLFKAYGERTVSLRERPTAFYLEYFYNIVLIDGSPADNLFSQSHSVRPKVSVQWSSFTSTELYYQFRYDNFEDFPERDAANNNFTIDQVFRLYNGSLLLKPGFNIALNSARDIQGTRNYDYIAPEVFLEAVAFLPFGITVFTEAHYFMEDYYNDPFDRVDNQIGVRAVVSKKLYKIFSLDLGYQHISNLSNSDFPGSEPFQYSRDIFSATFTARF